MSSKISKIFKRLQCSLYVKPWHFHPRSPAIIGRPNVFEDHAQVTEPLTWTRDCMALPRPLSAMVPWWLWKGTWDLDKFIRFRFRKEKTMQSGSKWKLLGCPDCNRLGMPVLRRYLQVACQCVRRSRTMLTGLSPVFKKFWCLVEIVVRVMACGGSWQIRKRFQAL